MRVKIKVVLFLAGLTFLISQKVFSQTGQSIDSWVSMATATPTGNGYGACIVYAEKDGNPKIYNIRGGTTGFGIYDINTNVWVSTTALPYAASAGAAMTWDGGNFIYMLLGGTTFYQFDISAATFTRLTDPPGSVTGGGAIVYVSTQVGLNWCYAFQGGSNVFWRYDINTNSWATMAAPGTTGAGSSLVWDGDRFIYALRATDAYTFRKYDINTNSWLTLAPVPQTIGAGGSITWDGVITSSNIYATRGNSDTVFWKYNISQNQWVYVSSTPATIGSNSGNRLARYGDYIYCRRGVTDDSFWRYRWRDVDPPGKITSFVAETGTNGGKINLSWVCPGNDDDKGNLPAGSTFYIQYASWTGVNFSTTTQPPAGGYDLYIPTGPVVQGSTVYYTIGGLQENDTYYFRIWAKDNAGNWSTISDGATAWAMFTTDFNPPDAISDLEALPITQDGQITLKWTSPGDDGSSGNLTGAYLIQYASHTTIDTVVWSTSNAQITISTQTVTPGSTQHYTIALYGGTTYYFRMWARDEAFNYSTISNATTIYLGIYPPEAITDLTATLWNSTCGAVALQWTAPSDPPSGGAVSSYIIRYATWNFSDADFNNVNRARINITPKSPSEKEFVVVTGLPSNQTIYFRIKSYDSVNNLSPIDTTETVASVNVPPHLVINQFAAGTISSTEEFVELYNPCSYDIDLQTLGLKLRYRSASGGSDTNRSITFASTTIKAYGYFLIGTSTNATNGKRLDATIGSFISNDANMYITLSESSDLSQAIDLVSFGNVTDPQVINYDVSLLSTLNNGNSLKRKISGLDTNLHNSDFELQVGTWTPKNSDDPVELPPWAIPNPPSWRQDLIEVNTGYIKWVIQDNATDEEALYISSDTNTGARLPGSFLGVLSGTGGTTSWIEINLSSNTKYTRYGEAYKTSGSSWSSGLTVCTLAYPPETVNLTPVNANTINISWNNSGASKYLIARSSSNFDAPWSTSAVILSPGTTHQDTGLLGNTTYWYRIYVYNQDDVLNQNFYSITVSTLTYPSAPTGFGITNRTATSITWSWTAPAGGCDGYRIYRATDNSLIADQGSATTFPETDLSTNTAYGRFVRAYNIVGESLSSNQATFYTLAVAPVNLQVTEVYSSSVTLQWSSGGNPSGTRFGLARAEDQNFTVNHTTFVGLTDNLTELTTVATGLGGNTTYYFRVWAYNGDGIESPYSNIVSTLTLPGLPGAPVGFYGVALSTVSIKWEWNITPNATYYQVYNQSDNSLLANLVGEGTTTWIEIDLSSNTQYSRYVKAGNEYGLSDPSNVVSKYTLAYPPTNLTATAISSSTINLEWNFSGATKYQVWYSTNLTNNYQVGSVNSPSISFPHQGLEAGVTYYYKIVPVNGDDIANYNFDFPVASTRTLPSPVVSFSTSAVTTVSITWMWTPATGADGYRIYRATDNSLIADQGSATTFIETGLSTNTAYGRYVRAVNTSGLGELSPKTTVYTLASQPSNLVVTDVGYNSVSLSWSANGNPSGTRYEVSMSTDNFVTNFSTPIKLGDNHTTTTAEITGLNVNTEYWFRVRAFNGENISTLFSNIVSTKTLSYQVVTLIDESFEGSFPPDGWWTNDVSTGAVQSTNQKRTGSYSVQFDNVADVLRTPLLENPKMMTFWLYATAGAANFKVENSSSPTGPWTALPGTPITADLGSTFNQFTFDLSGYSSIYIRWYRGGNRTYYLDDVKITGYLLPDTTAPVAISNLTALTGSSEGTVILNWTSPGDDGMEGTLNSAIYRIKYSTTSFNSFTKTDSYDFYFSTTGVAPGTAVSYVLGGLKPGTSYYFGIIVRDDSGNWSTWTKDAQTNTSNYAWALDLPPAPPTQVSATASNRKITLSWQNPSPDPGDIDKYWVYQATFSFSALTDGNVVNVATVSYPSSQITLDGLTNGIEYFYGIKSIDKGDTGDGYFGEALVGNLSSIVSTVPKIRPPSDLVATHKGTSISLSWTHSPDYTADNFAGYNIYCSADSSDGPYSRVAQLLTKPYPTSYDDTNNIDPKKTYYYLLRSSDTAGPESEPSNIATAIPDLIPPEITITRQLTSRDLGKDIAVVEFKITDDRFESGDRQGKIVSVSGKYRNVAAEHSSAIEKDIKISSSAGLGTAEFTGKGELDFTVFVIGSEGIEYYLEATDEVNTARWPKEGEWYRVTPPAEKPEQKFITPSNPELVFGKDVEEVIIRDAKGNEVWKEKSDGTRIIIWRGEDKDSKKVELGPYIYEMKTRGGKKKYGVVIIVK